jgi:hypothetical protein
MRRNNCTCSEEKQCKSCYDYDRRQKIRNSTWIFNNVCPSNLTENQEQILVGSLLGDAYIYQYKNQLNAGLAIGRAYKDLEYLKYQYDIFKHFCKSKIKKRDYLDKRTNKIYENVYFRTQVSEIFSNYKDKWYDNGLKIIPRDIKLSPLICAIWFCDDGSAVRYAKNKDRIKISIATDGFRKDDVVFLCSLLNKQLGTTKFSYSRKNSCKDVNKGYFIYGYHNEACKFIKYIEPVFPESMSRKSNKWKGLV